LGQYTAQLQNLKIGAEARIEGPFGVFSYLKSKNKEQVWIAGGIGITPFLSMAKSLIDKSYKIDLYYCVNTKSEMVFLEEFKKISFQNENFKIIPVCSDVDGRINIKIINKFSGNILKKDFFLCGPGAMMQGTRSILLENNVLSGNIHSEEFSF
jgi:predicted ferric reductase